MNKRLLLIFAFVVFAFQLNAQDKEKGADDLFPDISLVDRDSNVVKISDFKGKIIVLHFWTSWSGPCRAQMSNIMQIEKKLAKHPVTFLNISLDDNRLVWKTFVRKNYLGGIQLYAGRNRDIIEMFKIVRIPNIVVLDADGLVLDTDIPLLGDNSNLEQYINQLLIDQSQKK